MRYTERQQQILDGAIPISKASDLELERILTKAKYSYDTEAIDFINDELKRRGHNVFTRYYTSSDKDALADVSEADTDDLRHAVNVARDRADRYYGAILERELANRGEKEYQIDGYNRLPTQH